VHGDIDLGVRPLRGVLQRDHLLGLLEVLAQRFIALLRRLGRCLGRHARDLGIALALLERELRGVSELARAVLGVADHDQRDRRGRDEGAQQRERTVDDAALDLRSAIRERGHGIQECGLARVRAVTMNASEMLGWRDRIGGIEPGKLVDLVATHGDPVADIAQLQHVGFVMKGGEVVRNVLAP